MNIMNITTDCTDNGVGLRTVIYISGCEHRCEGCHNPSSWNVSNGTNMEIDEIIEIINSNEIADVTISGGDGLTYQYIETLQLLREIKNKTDKNVWLYTGFIFEDILHFKKEILLFTDVIVDGRFEIEERDLNLRFRGSRNQRIIDVKESLKQNKVVLWNNGD